jgi:hypothetical protein
MDRTLENISELVKNAVIAIIVTLMLKRGDRYVVYRAPCLQADSFSERSAPISTLRTFTNEYWGFGLARIQDIVDR